MACIAGGIAQAFYKTIPQEVVDEAKARIPEEFSDMVDAFDSKYNISY